MSSHLTRVVFRLLCIQYLALAPIIALSQVIIRERIDLNARVQTQTVMNSKMSSPTLRFEFKSEHQVFLRMFIQVPHTGEMVAFGTGQATLTLADAPYGTYAFNLQLRVADLWNPIVGSAVTFDIYVGDSLARHDEGRITGGWYSIFGIWRPDNFVLFPEVKIKIELASSKLTPLGDGDNKNNPNHSDTGPDKRKKIIDWSTVKKTNVTVRVNDLNGQPVSDYPFMIEALVRQESGGHNHANERPTGRFVTMYEETLSVLDDQTDVEGKAKYTYLCSGIGGVDSVFVRGIKETDTASAVVVVKVGDLEPLGSGTHYTLIGQTNRHPANHFGAKKTIDNLKMLADSAYADSSWTLQYNDISLTDGGPFDIKPEYEWDTPHQTHREGRSVDMRPVSTNGDSLSVEWLETFLQQYLKGTVQEEFKGKLGKHHFHLTF